MKTKRQQLKHDSHAANTAASDTSSAGAVVGPSCSVNAVLVEHCIEELKGETASNNGNGCRSVRRSVLVEYPVALFDAQSWVSGKQARPSST